MNTPLGTLLSFGILLLVFFPLERLHQANQQAVLRPKLGTDFAFFLGQYLLWAAPVVAALTWVATEVRALPLTGLQGFFAGLPIALQVVVSLLLADCAMYWFHRASHRNRFLWRFHRVHHTARDVDWLAAHREHPVDNLLTRLIENLPLLLLGIPLSAVAGAAMFRGLWALYIHANVTLDPGPLRYLLGSPRLHRWHHQVDHHARVNFANLCPLMDLAFGTYLDPRVQPDRFGVHERTPESWAGLILEPLGLWKRPRKASRRQTIAP